MGGEDDRSPIDLVAPLRNKVFGVLVSAVTFHEDRILLLQRSMDQKFKPGAWSIPAGKIQPREGSLEEAVRRELFEEAGIKGKVRYSLGMCWFESEYYEQPLHHIQFNFAVQAYDSHVVLLDRSNMAFRWIAVDEMTQPPVPIDDFTLNVIHQAIACVRAER
ncbi:NUDIX hydrolase [Microbispora bryophytorum]|uniref:NUDIX hydrolase n=1 Tax=Microbispora bryophytorum TaxID=1460882 RepID=UPI003405C8CA